MSHHDLELAGLIAVVAVVVFGFNIAVRNWKYSREQKRLMRSDRDKRK